MAEQRVDSLLDALDGRTRTMLERLAHEREARRHAESVQGELAQRLGELQRRLAEAEANRLELEEARRELSDRHRELSDKYREMNEKCLELQEECRELGEQNSELETHGRHLQERLTRGEPAAEGGFRPGRRSQGFSALIGRRPEPAGSHGDDSGQPPREGVDNASPDTSGSYAAAAPEAVAPGTAAPEATAPSPQALLQEWYQRYPGAFFQGHTRPLMVGIHEVLAAREPWPEKLVRRALACYVNLPRYLKAMREDAERIDLDGQPAGKVDAQSADYAHRKLERLQGEKRAGQGRNNSGRNNPGRGKPGKAGGQGKGKPKKGQGKGPSQGARQPALGRAEPAPATMEEKLAALMAKHGEK